MTFVRFRPLFAAAMLVLLPAALEAQARPTPQQAQELLRTRPELVQQLRQRIMGSGLTPDQIRARLRAEGYPETLLDAYLPGGSGLSEAPSDSVYGAVLALGITDSTAMDQSGLEGELRSFRQRASDTLSEETSAEDRSRRLPEELRWEAFRDVIRGPISDRAFRRQVRADDGIYQPLPDSAGPRPRPGTDTLPRPRRTAGVAGLVPVTPADMPADSGFRFFGLDVFRRGNTQFEPNLAGPVDANYRLGPGDRLVLVLTGDVEASYTLDVTREGFVVIPSVGRLDVANLTLGQLEDVLYTRLGRVYSGVSRGGGTTRFSVSPARLRANQVFVIGDVQQPGSYRVSSVGTALTALYAAGGPTLTGTLRNVQVRRAGRTVATLDVYDYLLSGDASDDPRLENGDVIFVSVRGPRVRVTGEVVRPATYEMKPGETLADVIRAAGGFTATAARQRVQIDRILPPGARATGRDQVILDVTADQLASAEGPAMPIEAGDIVHVFPVAERVRNRVFVRGNVWAPGSVGFTPGMMLGEALRLAGGVRPDVYLGQVLVTRLESDSTYTQLRATLRDTLGNVANDFPLREDDQVQVFSVSQFRPTRYVAINGAVRESGRFLYREGMTLRDLVLLAGGMEEGALLQQAEIARLPRDRKQGELARTVRVPLDSTYIFEIGPDGRYQGPPGMPAPAATAPEVELQPYDNVLILRQPTWRMQRTVTLTGEVRFPGTYSLQAADEKLSDVIARAGGVTELGHEDGIVFYRNRQRVGRIGVDVERALRSPRHRENLVMQDGDSIHIPPYTAVVQVEGGVNAPTAVTYVPGQGIEYYINAAGGPSARGDVRRAYVRQPNGKVESIRRVAIFGKSEPKPGAVIHVPERDPSDTRTPFPWTTFAQIAVSLITAVALLNQ